MLERLKAWWGSLTGKVLDPPPIGEVTDAVQVVAQHRMAAARDGGQIGAGAGSGMVRPFGSSRVGVTKRGH